MDNLLQNRLFLEYLSGAGSAMAQGESIAPALNQVTQRQLKAKSYANANEKFLKMLQGMLSGDIPEGGKMSMDSKGMKIDVPSTAMKGASMTPGITRDESGMATFVDPSLGGSGINWAEAGNPFDSSQPGIFSDADLAGLTPQDISGALSGALNVEALKSERVRDIVDAIYKDRMASVAEGGVAARMLETLSKDTRTTLQKNYEYARKQGFEGTIEEFDDYSKTSHEKDYERAKSEGYSGDFHSWLRDMTALGGGIDLEEYKKRRQASADVEIATAGRKYFSGKWKADIDKAVDESDALREFYGTPDEKRKRVEITADRVEAEIRSRGGIVEDTRLEGNTIIWKVKWPDGEVSEVPYAFAK